MYIIDHDPLSINFLVSSQLANLVCADKTLQVFARTSTELLAAIAMMSIYTLLFVITYIHIATHMHMHTDTHTYIYTYIHTYNTQI